MAHHFLVLFLDKAALNAQAAVGEVLAHVVLDLLGPDPPAALLDKSLDPLLPLLRGVGSNVAFFCTQVGGDRMARMRTRTDERV